MFFRNSIRKNKFWEKILNLYNLKNTRVKKGKTSDFSVKKKAKKISNEIKFTDSGYPNDQYNLSLRGVVIDTPNYSEQQCLRHWLRNSQMYDWTKWIIIFIILRKK